MNQRPLSSIEAQSYINDCREMLRLAENENTGDSREQRQIGVLILAIGQLARVVEDLAKREQGKVIQ